MKIKTLFLLLTICIPKLLIAQIDEDLLDTSLENYLKKSPVNGMAVAIFTSDSLLYANGFGYANQEKNIPYTIHTFQPIASITKTLVGVSLMKAQELQKLNLDEDINKYLPFKIVNPFYPDEIITIKHLATHTSGIKDRKLNLKTYLYDEDFPPLHKNLPFGLKRAMVKKLINEYNSNTEMPLENFLKNGYNHKGEWYSKKNFSKKKPGEYYEYSNNATALASLVLEGATGVDFKDFIEQYILTPLKMGKSGWSLNDYEEDEKSALYVLDNEIPAYESLTLADGGFITNILEFSKYMIAVKRGYEGENNILQAPTYQEMLKLQILPETNTGIFWDIQNKSIGHAGWDPGVSTLAYFSKSGTKGMIIFMNTTDYEVSMKHLTEVLKILSDNS